MNCLDKFKGLIVKSVTINNCINGLPDQIELSFEDSNKKLYIRVGSDCCGRAYLDTRYLNFFIGKSIESIKLLDEIKKKGLKYFEKFLIYEKNLAEGNEFFLISDGKLYCYILEYLEIVPYNVKLNDSDFTLYVLGVSNGCYSAWLEYSDNIDDLY